MRFGEVEGNRQTIPEVFTRGLGEDEIATIGGTSGTCLSSRGEVSKHGQ